MYIYIYIYIYIYLSIFIYIEVGKKKGVYFRDYSLVRGKIIGEEYPDGRVITKHACRDESIDSLFFPHLNTYCALLLRTEHCTT